MSNSYVLASPASTFSIMTKIEITNDIHLQIKQIEGTNSIETNLCSVNKLESSSFNEICPRQISKSSSFQMAFFLHLQMEIFCNFNFCHDRRIGLSSSMNRVKLMVSKCQKVEEFDPPYSDCVHKKFHVNSCLGSQHSVF